MKDEDRSRRVTEIREEMNKSANFMVVAGAVLVFFRLLNISPSEVDALGAKIALSDPVIVRGVIAIVFLHFFHSFVMLSRSYAAYRVISEDERQIARVTFRKYAKPGVPIKKSKFRARVELWIWNLFLGPYTIAFATLLLAALILSCVDVTRFLEYCYQHTSAGLYVQGLLSE